MARASLRQLSRQFARKVIDKSEYRRRRAELIDEIVATRDADHSTGPTTGTNEEETENNQNEGPRPS